MSTKGSGEFWVECLVKSRAGVYKGTMLSVWGDKDKRVKIAWSG